MNFVFGFGNQKPERFLTKEKINTELVKATYLRAQLDNQPANVRNDVDPAFVER